MKWKPFLFLSWRDELRDGHGSMQMNMLSLWPVTAISNNEVQMEITDIEYNVTYPYKQ
jgi:hypothetical protein